MSVSLYGEDTIKKTLRTQKNMCLSSEYDENREEKVVDVPGSADIIIKKVYPNPGMPEMWNFK